ncbi:MAG: sigma-70 family RNA polymerase sigma factor [bacterium]
MEINNALLEQWEPKVHKMMQGFTINGESYDDIAQELRFSIIKAAQHFDPSKQISFHTYLHAVMINTIRTLMYKSGRHPAGVPIQDFYDVFPSPDYEEFPIQDLNLDPMEKAFVAFFLGGYNISEIQRMGVSAKEINTIRRSLKDKLAYLKDGKD